MTKRIAVRLGLLLYVVSSLWWGPMAEAAFHLDYAEDVARDDQASIPVLREVSYYVPPAPAPKRVVATPVVHVAPTRNTDSSNPYVSPWGCEAEHAQQWSASGKYWGKYQFDRQTWAAHGGTNYGSASEAEQDAVAARVKYDAWPNC